MNETTMESIDTITPKEYDVEARDPITGPGPSLSELNIYLQSTIEVSGLFD